MTIILAIIGGIALAVLIIAAFSNRRSYGEPRFWGGGGNRGRSIGL